MVDFKQLATFQKNIKVTLPIINFGSPVLMNNNRIAVYGFLAYINETNRTDGNIKDFADIFVPLVKRVLSALYSQGITKGRLEDLKKAIDDKYGFDMPYPMVKDITKKIAKEFNNQEVVNFQAFEKDGSFLMRNYIFEDYEQEMINQENEIDLIQKHFEDYLKIEGVEFENKIYIYNFIEKNKLSLSKFFSSKVSISEENYESGLDFIQANFLSHVKENNIETFNSLKKVYLGSIIASYLEFSFEKTFTEMEFVLDTNFITSILNLNSIESFHTCIKIIEICKKMGYKLTILQDTIEETKNLILNSAAQYENSFLLKIIDTESIYSACERNNYTKTDLERIAHSFSNELSSEFHIEIIRNTQKYRNLATNSKEHDILKERDKDMQKTSMLGALHDATVIEYVKAKRGNKYIKKFQEAKCWFVNSKSDMPYLSHLQNGNQGNVIKAEDLINRLWLSNPSIIPPSDIAEIGLSRLISNTINKSIPSQKVLKQLDDKFRKYAESNKISDSECLRIAMSLSEKTLDRLKLVDELSKTEDENLFAKIMSSKLKDYEDLQKRRNDKIKKDMDILKNDLSLFRKKEKEKMIDSNKIKQNLLNAKKVNKDLEKDNIEKGKEIFILRKTNEEVVLLESFIEKEKSIFRKHKIPFIVSFPILLMAIVYKFIVSIGLASNLGLNKFIDILLLISTLCTLIFGYYFLKETFYITDDDKKMMSKAKKYKKDKEKYKKSLQEKLSNEYERNNS